VNSNNDPSTDSLGGTAWSEELLDVAGIDVSTMQSETDYVLQQLDKLQ